jgi:uncharacterized membrane protein
MYPQTNHTFESNKILAGVGAILAAIGSFVFVVGPAGFVHIVGIILVLIATHGLAEDYKDQTIFNRTLTGFIFNIVSAATFIAAARLVIESFTRGFFATRPVIGALAFFSGIGLWIVGFVFAVLAAASYHSAFGNLSDKSGEPLLKTGGLLLLIGAALSIIFVGFLLMFVTWLVLAAGFFQLRLPVASSQNGMQAPPQPSVQASSNGK